jgi:hypothetical protein
VDATTDAGVGRGACDTFADGAVGFDAAVGADADSTAAQPARSNPRKAASGRRDEHIARR